MCRTILLSFDNRDSNYTENSDDCWDQQDRERILVDVEDFSFWNAHRKKLKANKSFDETSLAGEKEWPSHGKNKYSPEIMLWCRKYRCVGLSKGQTDEDIW